MTQKFQELVEKLKEIFQLDKPELDFGVYRILHTRAKEITEFLEKRLAEKVGERLPVIPPRKRRFWRMSLRN